MTLLLAQYCWQILQCHEARWHTTILLHGIMAFWMWRKPDGRPKFSAWLVARFTFDAAQMIAERMGGGGHTASVSIYYAGVVVWCVLLVSALLEARERWHCGVLFSWTGLYMGAAWIRFFPYTGAAVVFIDAVAYVAWAWEKSILHPSLPPT